VNLGRTAEPTTAVERLLQSGLRLSFERLHWSAYLRIRQSTQARMPPEPKAVGPRAAD
jgi:hypothetical protein